MNRAKLMGVINVTPDSFSDGGLYFTHETAVKRAIEMARAGADIIDVGGESTRPGSNLISEEEEIRRVIPVIETLTEELNIPISIDTTKPIVAIEALKAGASLLNDVTGFTNPAMRHVAAEADVDICIMHMQGASKVMQDDPQYPNGVVDEIISFFEKQLGLLFQAGVDEKHIILDPGIGFGKNVQHNHQIFQGISRFKEMGYPVLLGCSRKSFLRNSLKKKEVNVLSATVCMNTIALLAGVDFLRVHDVEEHREVIDLLMVHKECVSLPIAVH